MSDPCYIVLNQRIPASAISLFSFAIFLIGCVGQYQDWKNTLLVYKFVYYLKSNLIAFPLNNRNHRKYSKHLYILIKYLMKNIFYLSVIITQFTYSLALILAHL